MLGVCPRRRTPGLVWLSLDAWCAHPAMPPGHRGCADVPERWQGPVLQGAAPWLWRSAWIFARRMCCALSPYNLYMRTGHLPSTHLHLQPEQCKESTRFCQRSVSARGPRKHVSAGGSLPSSFTHIPVLGGSQLCLVVTLCK